jgi:hypothetical protein
MKNAVGLFSGDVFDKENMTESFNKNRHLISGWESEAEVFETRLVHLCMRFIAGECSAEIV